MHPVPFLTLESTRMSKITFPSYPLTRAEYEQWMQTHYGFVGYAPSMIDGALKVATDDLEAMIREELAKQSNNKA